MGFSQAQKKAIKYGEGPCLVLAGPGSGKTMTIVNRVKNLIETQKVRPEEILVITFTKYAAKEMKTRLQSLMKGQNLPVTMGTFHGIYYGILKWAYKFTAQNILSEEEKYQILRQTIRQQDVEIFDAEEFLQDVVSEISYVKNQRIQIDQYESKKCNAAVFCEIYKEYERKRKSIRKIDFDDMLVLCYELFRTHPQVLAMWQKKFKYILVDEFQDINRIQYDVIKMLASPENNLFVVGDDDQSIYSFRGADAKIMFEFQRDYPNAEQILLDINYRSTANIVNNALKVIGHNEERFQKKIRAEQGAGVSLHVQETKDSMEESEYIVKEIAQRVSEGIPLEEIAVLYRTHSDARAVMEKLVESKIDFQMKEHMPNIYQHFIAKDIAAYFRMASGKISREDMLQVMNRPKRYISRDAISGSEKNLFFQLSRFYSTKVWMFDIVEKFQWDLKMMKKMAPYAAVQYLRKKVGYNEFLVEYASNRKVPLQDLYDVLSEIEEAMKPFASFEEWFDHVEEYTRTLSLREKGREKRLQGVQLMTIHSAKGLEFNTVFIIQANEGRLPYAKALKEHALEEERRLFYVAMTRAKECLRVSYVKLKNGKELSPSRFVDELFERVKS